MFRRILIANRGEIAVRIARACREMGIISVGVYSDVDRRSHHVRALDHAYYIGPAESSASYLNAEKILDVARRSGAEAVHPGYGFLSENAGFANACRDSGITFIGPSVRAMESMGSKTRSRQTMKQAGIPIVPGSEAGFDTADEAAAFAGKIGYPVMLKASAGGGGKGIRMVRDRVELRQVFEAARSEAKRAFGDDEVYLEKLIDNPRHVEMQILADDYGNVVYLGERECSVQRRHQKVMEEAPSPLVNPDMRRRMGEIAVRVAKAANYTNAGTVEFLLDQQGNFYFLEMNTRLQVEHPVTEMVTGLDLVQLQILVAAGEKLPMTQEEIQIRGHAIECRICAEDPDNHYFPSPGRITRLISPAGPGLRLDSGMYEGWNVPIEYDPLLSKLIAYGRTREDAINRLRRALGEIFVGGIKTNISLFRRVLVHPDFRAGRCDTGFLDRLLSEPRVHAASTLRRMPIAAIAAAIFAEAANEGLPEVSVIEAGRNSPARSDERERSSSGWKQQARREALH